jgi:hypothetical protein
VRAEQLGVRNTEAGFDAISLGLVADSDTAARLGFNTNGHDGDGLAAQFGAKFLFDRGEIGVEIDIATAIHDGMFQRLLRSEIAQNERHMDAAEFGRWGTLGSARIGGSFARRLQSKASR